MATEEKMEFILENLMHGARRGRLLIPGHTFMHVLETPSCLVHTRAGVIPNLTRDLEDQLPCPSPTAGGGQSSCGYMLTMPTLYKTSYKTHSADLLSHHGLNIHEYLHRETQLLYMSVQDPGSPTDPSYNMEKSVSVWNCSGRCKVTVEDHMTMIHALRPNLFECLYDSAPEAGNKLKRIRKSVDRTLRFLDATIAAIQEEDDLRRCCVFAAVVGSDNVAERSRSAKESALRPVDGFVLEGLDQEHSQECLGQVLQSAISNLPEMKPRLIHGLHRPEDIIEAVENGVDVFDSSYAHKAADAGRAVVFGRGVSSSSDNEVTEGQTNQSEPWPFEIDLNDKKFENDFRPFRQGCKCYACTSHSRAYTHHLLVTKEILAAVLLMIHNLTHYLTFFTDLRRALGSTEAAYKDFKLNHAPLRH